MMMGQRQIDVFWSVTVLSGAPVGSVPASHVIYSPCSLTYIACLTPCSMYLFGARQRHRRRRAVASLSEDDGSRKQQKKRHFLFVDPACKVTYT